MATKALTHFLLVGSIALGIHAQSSTTTVPPSSTPISTQQTSTLSLMNVFQVLDAAPHTYQVIDTPQMYSDKWEVGTRLIGYVQLQIDVVSLASCFSQCTRMLPNCESLNMSLNPKVNTTLYICELNSKSIDEDPMAQIDDPDYIYYDVFSNM